MIYTSLPDFARQLAPGKRLLGLDVGNRKIGVALSDTTLTIATPYDTLIRQSFAKDVAGIEALIDRHLATGIVAGLPMTMRGEEEESARMVREFMAKLLKQRDMAVYFQDERFSTAAVTRALSETSLTRKKKGLLDDKMAASYILQGALDQLKFRH
jgi:putative holliday junction resolvase